MIFVTRDQNNVRARHMFPGRVFNVQESRKRTERKFRDWDGWLELVAEYHKEELLSKRTETLLQYSPASELSPTVPEQCRRLCRVVNGQRRVPRGNVGRVFRGRDVFRCSALGRNDRGYVHDRNGRGVMAIESLQLLRQPTRSGLRCDVLS